MDYFERIGFPLSHAATNPADHALDVVQGDVPRRPDPAELAHGGTRARVARAKALAFDAARDLPALWLVRHRKRIKNILPPKL